MGGICSSSCVTKGSVNTPVGSIDKGLCSSSCMGASKEVAIVAEHALEAVLHDYMKNHLPRLLNEHLPETIAPFVAAEVMKHLSPGEPDIAAIAIDQIAVEIEEKTPAP